MAIVNSDKITTPTTKFFPLEHFIENIFSVSSTVTKQHNLALKLILEVHNRSIFFCHNQGVTNSAFPITFFMEKHRLYVRFSQFEPTAFANMFGLSLDAVVADVKQISSHFYKNEINIQQQNILLNVISKNVETSIKISMDENISVDVGDHFTGGPLHLTLDLCSGTPNKLEALKKLISISAKNG